MSLAPSTALARTEVPVQQVLVVNPNTNPLITRLVGEAASRFATPWLRLDVVNPPRGPMSIETVEERALAERESVSFVHRRSARGYDAFVMACFDDLALDQLRGLLAAPVVGTCEAGMAAARALSPRFAIVTTFDAALPGIRLLMQRYGAGPLATARAAGVGVAAAAAAAEDTVDRIVQCARRAVSEDGAEVILLASGGLTGLAPRLSAALGRPVVDGVAAAIGAAVAQLPRVQAARMAST